MKTGFELLVLALGGACGALLRYVVTHVSAWLFKGGFAWGTLLSNLVGCLLIGLLIGSGHDQKSEAIRIGFGVGFLGSLTTFSTFGADTIKHAMAGEWAMAATNVASNVTIGLLAVAIGIGLARRFSVGD